MKDIAVLLTGTGAPGAPGIIKCLRKNGERNIRVVGVDMNENAGARDMVDCFFTVPAAKDDGFIPAVLEICHTERVDVVLPIVTRELMKFAISKSEFEDMGTKVSVISPSTLEIVNNKANLLTEMKKRGLPTPEFVVVHTLDEIIYACKKLDYPNRPICIKGAVGNGSRGVRILDPDISRYDLFFNDKPNSMYISYEELIRTLSERAEIPEMLVMEYLPGSEFSVDCLSSDGFLLHSVCRKGLDVVTSNMMSLEILNNTEVLTLCESTARDFNLDGNYGFDLRYSSGEKKPFIIEVNPRLTAGVVSCAAAGVNLPYLGVKCLLGEKLPKCSIHYGMRMTRRYEEVFTDENGKHIDW